MFDFLKEILKEICDENDIKYTFLSRDLIIRLEKNYKHILICGGKFPLNSISSACIASDKYATYDVIKNAGVPIIEHKMIFNKKTRTGYVSDLNNKNEIKNYLNSQYNKMVVVKANEGSCGKDVYLCKSVHEINKILDKIFRKKDSASICPFYDIETEYRVICLDDEIKLVYGKKPASGSWKHNLSQGAKVINVDDEELIENLKNIAIKAMHAIGLRFGSVDIIKLKSGELLIIEINSIVTINKYMNFVDNGRDVAKKIYKEAILKCFEEYV